MSAKVYYPMLAILFLGMAFSLPLTALPNRYSKEDPPSNGLKNSLEEARHQISNHEVEIRAFEEKLRNQDSTIEGLRQELLDYQQRQKESLEGDLELKISNLEVTTKGLVADCKQLKDHLNETTNSLNQTVQKIARVEKILETQNQNMANLDAALRSTIEALQVKEQPIASVKGTSDKIYRVKAGDSLEKIAKEQGTTVQAIRELNQLTSDRIVIGQKLQLP